MIVEIIRCPEETGVRYQVQCPDTGELTWHWVNYSCLDYQNAEILGYLSDTILIDIITNYHHAN